MVKNLPNVFKAAVVVVAHQLIIPEIKGKSALAKSCSRWSIVGSLLLYVVSFTLVRLLETPLKTYERTKTRDCDKKAMDISITEYLRRLHNLKSKQGTAEEGGDRGEVYLEGMFHKADYNRDNYLSVEEASVWINAKTQQRIHEATVDNYKVFTAIDIRPKDGLISWNEYHRYFYEQNGMNISYVAEHSEKQRGLSRTIKEAIIRDKTAWSECAKADPDHLDLDEFLSFRHPESSHSTVISLVDEIYKKFDLNEDEILTEYEFFIKTEDEESESFNQEEKEKRKVFLGLVDLNKDGKATKREMMTYIDPKNPRHAKEEAEALVGLADADRDGRLSLLEVFNKIDLFLGSKMVDTAGSFHDEF